MKRAIVIAAVFVAGCDGPSLTDKQRDEVEDLASSVAYDTVTEHDKVSELESRIEELESQIN